MMKSYFLQIPLTTLLFLCTVLSVRAQSFFMEAYESSPYNQEGQDVLPTADGGFLIAGYTTNNILYDCDILVIKTNSSGQEVWRKTFGGNKPDFPYHMLETYDGNYFLIGYSQSYGSGDYDIFLLKISPAGNFIWQKTYGGTGHDTGYDIIKTLDGNYMIVGSSNSQGFADQDANLIKIDPNGTVKWSKMYGGNEGDFGFCVKQTSDSGYIMIGQTYSYNAPGGDAYLVKLNKNGDTTWTKRFGGPHNDEGVYVTVANDGGYVFVIRDSSGVGKEIDIRVIKTNSSGTVIWNKVYGGDKKDTPKMIQKTSDGGYIIGGHSRSFGWINPDMWILKCNANGDTLWTRHYGGYDHEHCYVVRPLSNGSFIAVGKTASYGPDFDPILLKINSSGTMTVGFGDLAESSGNIDIFPNPASTIVNVKLTGNRAQTVYVRDLNGREIISKVLDETDEFNVDMSDQGPGLYFVTCLCTNEVLTRKLIVR